MVQQCIHGRLAALHQVHHARRKPGLLDQFHQPQRANGTRSLGFSTTVLPVAIA